MDFNDTPDEAAFRGEVRHFLDAEAPSQRAGGPVPSRRLLGDPDWREAVKRAKQWQAKKAAAALFAKIFVFPDKKPARKTEAGILAKLGAETRTEAVAQGARLGLVML